MKAIILNSGLGKRMGSLTADVPKCMVPLTSTKTILDTQIELLSQNKITELIITTGPFSDKIEGYISQKYPSLDVRYINNPLYLTSNYIYSIHLIPDQEIHSEILLLHGDLIIEKTIFQSILTSALENCVLVNKDLPQPKKDFKGRIINGQVTEIGVNIFDSNCFTLMPLYKLTSKFFRRWKIEIRKFIDKGTTDVYAENAFNIISDELQLSPFYYSKEFCMEIDTPDDLELAKTWISRGK